MNSSIPIRNRFLEEELERMRRGQILENITVRR
jgi:hypothetical protein